MVVGVAVAGRSSAAVPLAVGLAVPGQVATGVIGIPNRVTVFVGSEVIAAIGVGVNVLSSGSRTVIARANTRPEG